MHMAARHENDCYKGFILVVTMTAHRITADLFVTSHNYFLMEIILQLWNRYEPDTLVITRDKIRI